MGHIRIPKTATYHWYDNIVHYSKYKDIPIHEYTVQLPTEMPELKPKEVILFLFLIKEDNTIALKVRPR